MRNERKNAEIEPVLDFLLKHKGIKAMLVDMDDTLVQTTPHFQEKIGAYCAFIASNGTKTENEVFEILAVTINGMREHHNADPFIMHTAARVAALAGGVDLERGDYHEQYYRLIDVYHEPPVIFDGVVETIDMFLGIGIDIGVNTQSAKRWTDSKIDSNGLRGKFCMVHCVDPRNKKNSNEWLIAVEQMNVRPDQLMVVGDSWSSDIRPALDIGIPADQIFRVHTEYDQANHGRIEGIREISTFSELPMVIVDTLCWR